MGQVTTSLGGARLVRWACSCPLLNIRVFPLNYNIPALLGPWETIKKPPPDRNVRNFVRLLDVDERVVYQLCQ
jgi:hypothetical protein